MPATHVTDLTGVSYCPQRQMSIAGDELLINASTSYETVWDTNEDSKKWTDREKDTD